MNRKPKTMLITILGGMMFFSLLHLSGCTSNQIETQNIDNSQQEFIGTWVGTLQIPMFGADENATMSQISFTTDCATIVLTNDNRTFSRNYSYSVNNDSLILTPMIRDRGMFPGGRLQNETNPWNGTSPSEVLPPNGTQPPGDGFWPPNGTNPSNRTWPSNGTRPPGENRASMTLTFLYTFDEEATVLLLDGIVFMKVQ